jgi:membrane fusion protein (multidrug efflux system)
MRIAPKGVTHGVRIFGKTRGKRYNVSKLKICAGLVVMVALVVFPLSGYKLREARSDEQSQQESHAEEHGGSEHKIVVTSPVRKDVISTQPYVCQIHSCKHIEICALEGGDLQEIAVKEGQAVKKGDLMFQIIPVLY